jgi:hypothetical protein
VKIVSAWQRTLNLASLDVVGDILGAAAINLASDGESGTKDLLHGSLKLTGQGLAAHGAGNVDDVIERDRLGVLDVLLLLAVTGRLLEGLDDKGRGRGNDRDGSLTVLDAQLDGDTETFLFDASIQNSFTFAKSGNFALTM